MATDTVPAAAPGPPDPHSNADTTRPGPRGLLAAMVAPVEPARPTFDLNPPGTTGTPSGPGDALDRSAPGVSSASFRDTTDQAAKADDPAGSRNKRSIWKELWLAAAARWAKGGGTANKRLDLEKARAQAKSHQVKENRTSTSMKSGGLPIRNTGGSGAGSKGNSGKPGGSSSGKGPVNSSGSNAGGAGRGGSGGGRGPGGAGGHGPGSGRGGRDGSGSPKGSRGTDRSGTGGGSGKAPAGGGKGSAGGGPADRSTKNTAKTPPKTPTGGGAGGPGKAGASGKSGKDGSPGTGTDAKGPTAKTDLTKKPKHDNSKAASQQTAVQKTPLQKSRETGHGDGSKARRVVDHVKAYADGTRDGWNDEKTKNAKEHGRLDKARADRKPTTNLPGKDRDDDKAPAAGPKTPPAKDPGKPDPLKATAQGRTVLVEDDNAPMEDPFMAKPTPIQAKGIDTDKITLGEGFLKPSIKRSELRTFKQYEGRLESRIDGLARVVDATKALAAQAQDQAKDCQDLAEAAKSVKGGEKLVAELAKLADKAKAQADEAQEVHQRAQRAHDFGKGVLANIQARYAPLYQAVVDSDEIKPAELKFYTDRGVYPADYDKAA